VSKAYSGRTLFDDFSHDIAHDARIAITGANGAGKSTLLKIIAGLETADSGQVRIAHSVRLGYLPQEAAGIGLATLFEAFAEGLDGERSDLMNVLLQTGLFRYDDTFTPVGSLSAGQQRKLQLARLMATRANVLLLDEPTNHLSMDVLEELEVSLRGFAGAVIAVSHDRRFLAGFGGEAWELPHP